MVQRKNPTTKSVTLGEVRNAEMQSGVKSAPAPAESAVKDSKNGSKREIKHGKEPAKTE